MGRLHVILVTLGYCALQVSGFWRMGCDIIQRGRVDPIISPDAISGHTHTIGGAFNINTTSTYDSLQAAPCTTCDIQQDKSAYWTPLLYYQYKNGSFIPVPNTGTTVYYLGRGNGRFNMTAFPEGFRMLSGAGGARAYDNKTWTYSVGSDPGRPVSDRVSFNCINYTNPIPEQPYMFSTNCPQGLRAQIQFQSCWDGVNVYLSDQSHVAYMSQIDNGYCPPSHPVQLPHLFFEMYYFPNEIDTSDNGTFVFAQGDTTGYGFHGDFMNGWNTSVLQEGIAQCINTIDSGLISDCPPLQASYDPYTTTNCPRRPPLVNEQVEGVLSQLPGCNKLTYGPATAPQGECATEPSLLPILLNLDYTTRWIPQVNDTLGNFSYLGCANDTGAGSAGDGSPLGGISNSYDSLTLDGCQDYCKSKGFSLAGVEFSTYCHCSNNILTPLLDPAVCAATFTMACGGNLTQTCGAPNIMHIWNDTSYSGPALKGIPIANSTVLQTPAGNASYRGCYVDSTSARALSSASYVNNTGMTIESCASFCNSNGYTIFGTEYAQECYCGSSMPTINTSQSDCSMTCTGDPTEFCGNGNRLSVWSLSPNTTTASSNGILPSISGVTYLGCYSDSTSSRALATSYSISTSSGMTIDSCAQVAQANNLAYFGLEYASQCWAGNLITNGTTTGQPIASGRCSMPCQGNSSEYCGGSNALSMFQNTRYAATIIPAIANVSSSTTSTQSAYAYVGCYTEGTTGRSIGSANSSTPSYSTAGSAMTVEYCVTACFNKGFLYAGLEYADECYCNSVGIVNGGALAPGGNADCNMVCAANAQEYCGAGNRVQVYKLVASTSSSSSITASSTSSTSSSTQTNSTTSTSAKTSTTISTALSNTASSVSNTTSNATTLTTSSPVASTTTVKPTSLGNTTSSNTTSPLSKSTPTSTFTSTYSSSATTITALGTSTAANTSTSSSKSTNSTSQDTSKATSANTSSISTTTSSSSTTRASTTVSSTPFTTSTTPSTTPTTTTRGTSTSSSTGSSKSTTAATQTSSSTTSKLSSSTSSTTKTSSSTSTSTSSSSTSSTKTSSSTITTTTTKTTSTKSTTTGGSTTLSTTSSKTTTTTSKSTTKSGS